MFNTKAHKQLMIIHNVVYQVFQSLLSDHPKCSFEHAGDTIHSEILRECRAQKVPSRFHVRMAKEGVDVFNKHFRDSLKGLIEGRKKQPLVTLTEVPALSPAKQEGFELSSHIGQLIPFPRPKALAAV